MYQSMYDIFFINYNVVCHIYIYAYTRIDLYKHYDDMMICGMFTSATVTTSLRSVIDTLVASIMVNLWAVTPRHRLYVDEDDVLYKSVCIYIYNPM